MDIYSDINADGHRCLEIEVTVDDPPIYVVDHRHERYAAFSDTSDEAMPMTAGVGRSACIGD